MSKKSGKKIFVVFLVFLLISFFMLLIGYLYFETNRLSLYGIKPFSDVKSYTASLMKKIPILNSKIEYKPLNVVPYQKLLEEKLDSFQEVLDSQAASLATERKKLQSLKEELKKLKITLEASQTKLKAEIEKFNEKVKKEQSYEYRLTTLNQWITNSDPSKIGKILADSKIPIDVLVEALMRLPAKTAGNILQSIAQTNPTLAASIIYALAEGKK
jgi:flagellar motility protein MotE (MotC chaperone)